NRLPVLAHRVAPIQIAYLGYPDTTGLAAMDYRLTDNIVDPDESADHYYTEKLIRFSSTAWVYQPPFDAPPATRIADEKPGIVFGSFNNFAKVSDTVLQLWSQVLRAVPNSRMVIKAQGLQDPLIRNWVLARMKTLDVAEDRLELLGRTAGVGSHLALYRKIDIALDSFPYHGTTTTCEALWMGVPVVTLLGDRHLSRVSASLLRAAHHPEWVAHSKEEYVRIASELAAAPERLVQIRSNLRSDLERGPLLDHAGQANRFGSVLRDMWAAHCAAEVSLKAS
ncbi:MAG TPA: hypothetical protein VKC60_17120, partial [Opitutaceae bacterium]|nr:hypothetical protein [Opitutaceae bacterium]